MHPHAYGRALSVTFANPVAEAASRQMCYGAAGGTKSLPDRPIVPLKRRFKVTDPIYLT